MNATSVIAIPSTGAQPSAGSAGLIGGIVGGIVAALLVGGLVAFLVVRSRRSANQQDNNIAMANTAAPNNDYGRMPPATTNYSDHVAVDASPRNHYDSLTPNEL
jgi:flagellar basal body-associated protein FliL